MIPTNCGSCIVSACNLFFFCFNFVGLWFWVGWVLRKQGCLWVSHRCKANEMMQPIQTSELLRYKSLITLWRGRSACRRLIRKEELKMNVVRFPNNRFYYIEFQDYSRFSYHSFFVWLKVHIFYSWIWIHSDPFCPPPSIYSLFIKS